ncbi:hypothetical protein G9A89_008852 [Geosiphon pyriformis]|nr:hypothetical protein G9A89_008852 [Geosiphon pyriformis]
MPAGCHKEKICKLAGDFVVRSRVIQILHEAELSSNLYILLAKEFVLKSWAADIVLSLGSASGDSLIVKLVCSLAKSHRSNIWVLAAKLKAFYKKHNLLSYNKSTVLSVANLLDLWTVGITYSFGIRLDIYMCFGLCLCLTSLGFSFLSSIFLTDLVCALYCFDWTKCLVMCKKDMSHI